MEEMPLNERQIYLNLQNTHLVGGEFPLPDSETWTAKGEWSNVDIDSVVAMWKSVDPSVTVLPAKFIVDAQKNPYMATDLIQEAQRGSTGGIIQFVLWIRHHWVIATIRDDAFEFCDSAPGIVQDNDIRSIADFIGLALNKSLQIITMRTPCQPKHSVECGAHSVVNLMMSHANYFWPREAADKTINRVSYHELHDTLQLFTEGELRLDYVKTRILQVIGEARCPLLTHSRLLAIADNWTHGNIKLRWMGATKVQTWVGSLIKRKTTHWQIKFEEDDGVGILPNKNVCYLTAEPTLEPEIEDLRHTHGDLLCLNFEPPPSTARVEGDSMKMSKLKELLQGDPKVPSNELFMKAYAPTTRKHQRQILTWLKGAPNSLNNLPCSIGIPQLIMTTKQQRRWRCSTTLTKMASIQGTLKILPFYHPTAPSIILGTSMHWRTAMRGAQIAANGEAPHQAKPATSEEIYKTLDLVKEDVQLHAAIEIAWLTAGRIGDIIILQPEHICEVREDVMMVKFMTGKTARNGHYSIAIPMPGERTKQYLLTCRTPSLFPTVRQDGIKDSLRRIDTRLECRSIRRGRLQELSRGGMSDSGLLHISRHAEIAMLRRYLDFGLSSGENIKRATMAAEAATKAAIKARQSNAQISEPQSSSKEGVEEVAPPQRIFSVPCPPSPPSSDDSFL